MITSRLIPVLVLTLGLAACAAEPFVLNTDEFKRGSANFAKDVPDRGSVTICYRSSTTTPATVRALAVNACGTLGKTAHFVEQNYRSCPLSTPVSAVYDCIGAEDMQNTGQSTGTYPYYFQNTNPY